MSDLQATVIPCTGYSVLTTVCSGAQSGEGEQGKAYQCYSDFIDLHSGFKCILSSVIVDSSKSGACAGKNRAVHTAPHKWARAMSWAWAVITTGSEVVESLMSSMHLVETPPNSPYFKGRHRYCSPRLVVRWSLPRELSTGAAAPLVDALIARGSQPDVPLHVPGHKVGHTTSLSIPILHAGFSRRQGRGHTHPTLSPLLHGCTDWTLQHGRGVLERFKLSIGTDPLRYDLTEISGWKQKLCPLAPPHTHTFTNRESIVWGWILTLFSVCPLSETTSAHPEASRLCLSLP